MTKAQIEAILADLEDDDEVDLNELAREEQDAYQDLIEELEERQHAGGFYAFQDMMELMRFER